MPGAAAADHPRALLRATLRRIEAGETLHATATLPNASTRHTLCGNGDFFRLQESSQVSEDKNARPKPDRLSSIAEGAAARWGDEHPDADPPHAPPSNVPEDPDIVPNRHSASAEAAALRWSEQHGDAEE